MDRLLTIRDLHVTYTVAGGGVQALKGLNLHVSRAQAIGLLGESGSGKSTLTACILNLLPNSARASGEVLLDGADLLKMPERQLRSIRGARIAHVWQDPSQALSPVLKVGDQIADVMRAHQQIGWEECRRLVEQVLRDVGLADVDRIQRAYPHQLSGGQRQRVAIAQALICRPTLLLADEPTTALDTTTQAEILALIKGLRQKYRMALLLISHDPAVIAEMVDYVYVLRAGSVVEHGPTDRVMSAPESNYTRSLIEAVAGFGYTHA
jgi:ABC-type glutathione transport system ATPase component